MYKVHILGRTNEWRLIPVEMCFMRQHSESQNKQNKDRIINLLVTGFTQRYRRTKWNIDSKGFWRWCITLRITGFSDFFHRPVFWKLENTTFRKLDLFPSSDDGGGKTPTQLGPLRLALSKGPNWVGVFSSHLRTETDPVFETLCFLVSRIPDDGKSPKTQ
jgi:hypothetical protein